MAQFSISAHIVSFPWLAYSRSVYIQMVHAYSHRVFCSTVASVQHPSVPSRRASLNGLLNPSKTSFFLAPNQVDHMLLALVIHLHLSTRRRLSQTRVAIQSD